EWRIPDRLRRPAILRPRRDDRLRDPGGAAPGVHLHDPHRGLRERVDPPRALSPGEPIRKFDRHTHPHKETPVSQFVSLAVTQADALKSGLGSVGYGLAAIGPGIGIGYLVG